MLETTLSGLLIAGISGLTVLAYKHPRGYAVLFPYLLGTTFGTLLLGTLWNLDLALTLSRTVRFIPPDRWPEAEKAINGQRISFLWLGVSGIGFLLYAIFLSYLPMILQQENRDVPAAVEKTAGELQSKSSE